MRRISLILLAVHVIATPLRAEKTHNTQSLQAGALERSVAERFESKETSQTPDFQRHVAPLFGKLGCNGRECHGSFQGRGGFRLSLFGYDFEQDIDALFDEKSPRVNLSDPEKSLIIQMPTNEDQHGGGKRYELGSWQHHVLVRWIETGAKYSEQPHSLTQLEVKPAKIQFRQDGERVRLQAIAVWSDGSREDVTPLCRFESNDAHVATIEDNGWATCTGRGDTHIIVSYDRAVVPVPVLRPITELVGNKYPKTVTPTKIDELVVARLRDLGIVQSELCDDAEFLRRVRLDMTGTLPRTEEIVNFLNDEDPEKRSKKIDELLESPSYADWWTTKMCDFLGIGTIGWSVPRDASRVWYNWLHKRIASNTPYDALVEELVPVRTPLPGQSFIEYCEQMSDLYRKKDKTFADMPAQGGFWNQGGLFEDVEKRAIVFAYAFMGTRIQCAQCHKHPYDEWSKKDFHLFKSYFSRFDNSPKTLPKEYRDFHRQVLTKCNEMGIRPADAVTRHGMTITFPTVRLSKRIVKTRSPDQEYPYYDYGKLPGRDAVDLSELEDPRVQLVEWLRSADNRYFAHAFANRVWASYFHAGIVNPTDDLSVGNPPSNKPLLDYLAKGFRESGFNMKWLHRTIANSRTYQVSWEPNKSNRQDERHFSHAIPRRLPAEVLYDAIVHATAWEKQLETLHNGSARRAISNGALAGTGGSGSYAVRIFGRMPRKNNCDCDRTSEPTQLQTLYLQNDKDVIDRLPAFAARLLKQAASDRLASDAKTKHLSTRSNVATQAKQKAIDDTADAKWTISQIYLRTVCRYPSDEESERMLKYVRTAASPTEGLRDVVWVLLNTKEFVLNH